MIAPNAGVDQGFVAPSFFFHLYIYDLPSCIFARLQNIYVKYINIQTTQHSLPGLFITTILYRCFNKTPCVLSYGTDRTLLTLIHLRHPCYQKVYSKFSFIFAFILLFLSVSLACGKLSGVSFLSYNINVLILICDKRLIAH